MDRQDTALDLLVEQIIHALGKSTASQATRDAIKNGILNYKNGKTGMGAGFEDALGVSRGLGSERVDKAASSPAQPTSSDEHSKIFYA